MVDDEVDVVVRRPLTSSQWWEEVLCSRPRGEGGPRMPRKRRTASRVGLSMGDAMEECTTDLCRSSLAQSEGDLTHKRLSVQ